MRNDTHKLFNFVVICIWVSDSLLRELVKPATDGATNDESVSGQRRPSCDGMPQSGMIYRCSPMRRRSTLSDGILCRAGPASASWGRSGWSATTAGGSLIQQRTQGIGMISAYSKDVFPQTCRSELLSIQIISNISDGNLEQDGMCSCTVIYKGWERPWICRDGRIEPANSGRPGSRS